MEFKILVVDDEEDIVQVFKDILEMEDYTVFSASNGKEAVKIFEKNNPDLVILDVMMPEFDGIYALNNIRKINPNSKIILVTADAKVHEKIGEQKPSRILTKPVDYDVLIEAVKEIQN